MNPAELPKINQGRTIRTISGIYVDVFDPNPEMFNIEDIAHALSNLCRWGGHVPRFYSVAQHSVFCARMARYTSDMKQALLHDATEAYLVDLPRPIKREIKQYQEIEENLMKVIMKAFNLNYPLAKEVKEIDDQVLNFEHEQLIIRHAEGLELQIECWEPMVAKRFFLDEFNELFKTNGSI